MIKSNQLKKMNKKIMNKKRKNHQIKYNRINNLIIKIIKYKKLTQNELQFKSINALINLKKLQEGTKLFKFKITFNKKI